MDLFMRIAIFGGSFDPVHNEHIRLAEAAIRSLALDKLLIMPAFSAPHKPWKKLSPNADRLQMCKLAFAHLEKAEVCDYEIEQGGTSYTYLTCRHFRSLYQDAEIFWLVGGDMLRDFPTWKNPQSILNDVTLAVCGREEKADWAEKEQRVFFERFGVNFHEVHYNGKAVSSTKIRILAGAGMRLTDFTPLPVAQYIQEKKLYEIPNADKALALEKPLRRQHSLRVAKLAVMRAGKLKISEQQAMQAALFHDCGKNVPLDSPLLKGFVLQKEWGDVSPPVLHQFTGAYLAEHVFGVKDEAVLLAIRYHTSGRANMSELEKLLFLADMLESERDFDGVENLRTLFWQDSSLDECLAEALAQSLKFIEEKGEDVYPLTKQAYTFYKEKQEKEK